MNAAQFNTELNELFNKAISEGVSARQMGFETMLGVITTQKHALLTWNARNQALAAMAANPQPPTILKPGE